MHWSHRAHACVREPIVLRQPLTCDCARPSELVTLSKKRLQNYIVCVDCTWLFWIGKDNKPLILFTLVKKHWLHIFMCKYWSVFTERKCTMTQTLCLFVRSWSAIVLLYKGAKHILTLPEVGDRMFLRNILSADESTRRCSPEDLNRHILTRWRSTMVTWSRVILHYNADSRTCLSSGHKGDVNCRMSGRMTSHLVPFAQFLLPAICKKKIDSEQIIPWKC